MKLSEEEIFSLEEIRDVVSDYFNTAKTRSVLNNAKDEQLDTFVFSENVGLGDWTNISIRHKDILIDTKQHILKLLDNKLSKSVDKMIRIGIIKRQK